MNCDSRDKSVKRTFFTIMANRGVRHLHDYGWCAVNEILSILFYRYWWCRLVTMLLDKFEISWIAIDEIKASNVPFFTIMANRGVRRLHDWWLVYGEWNSQFFVLSILMVRSGHNVVRQIWDFMNCDWRDKSIKRTFFYNHGQQRSSLSSWLMAGVRWMKFSVFCFIDIDGAVWSQCC